MKLKDKLEIFKDYGWKYSAETGDLISHKNKIVSGNNCRIIKKANNLDIRVQKYELAWFLETGEVVEDNDEIDYIDGDRNNLKFNNLRFIKNKFEGYELEYNGKIISIYYKENSFLTRIKNNK